GEVEVLRRLGGIDLEPLGDGGFQVREFIALDGESGDGFPFNPLHLFAGVDDRGAFPGPLELFEVFLRWVARRRRGPDPGQQQPGQRQGGANFWDAPRRRYMSVHRTPPSDLSQRNAFLGAGFDSSAGSYLLRGPLSTIFPPWRRDGETSPRSARSAPRKE